MPLDATTLANARIAAKAAFNDKTLDELVQQYGSLANARLQEEIADSNAIIEHFKNNALLTIPGAGLTAGQVAVSGASTTGTIS